MYVRLIEVNGLFLGQHSHLSKEGTGFEQSLIVLNPKSCNFGDQFVYKLFSMSGGYQLLFTMCHRCVEAAFQLC